MPDEVVKNGSPEGKTAPVEGSAGTTEGTAGEQPKPSEGEVDVQQLIKERDNAVNSYNEYRAMADKQRTKLEERLADLESRVTKAPEASPLDDGISGQETIDKLRKMAKEDPLTAFALLMKADRMAREKEAPSAPDPTLTEVKNERLINKTLVKMGVADVPRDEIYNIMNELGMRPDSELAVKTAIEIHKGRTAGQPATPPKEGAPPMQSHDKPSERVRKETVGEYSPTDKVAISAAINRNVFNGVKEFEDFSKEVDELPTGNHGGVIITDLERQPEGAK